MPLYFLSEIQKCLLTNMQKNEILVQTALTVGLFWTILKSTALLSALLSFTILYVRLMIIS